MTSRKPDEQFARYPGLRLVSPRSVAAARKEVTGRRTRPDPRPPAGTPATADLANRARASLADAVRLTRWAERNLGVGDGGLLAPAGALSPSDVERVAREMGLTHGQIRVGWDRARLAGLVEVHGGHARPGWRLHAWERDDTAVLRGWVALFDAWSLVHPAPAGIAPSAVAEVVEAMPQLLSLLQLSAGPVTTPVLLDLLGQRVTELRDERCEVPDSRAPDAGTPEPAPSPDPASLARLLRWALGCLGAVDALTLGPAHATLTPLGSWAVWVKLEQICVAAESPAGNIEQSATAMLRGCARLTARPARAEYRSWLAARPVGSAITELLQAARGKDALVRGLAFEALRVIGAPAEPDVRAAAGESALRPYALLWLAEHEGADPDDAQEVLTAEELTWLWVDIAAAIADHGEAELLARHLDSAVRTTVPRLLDEVRAVGHPQTVQVLVALAAAHPDPALAKAFRRAAFQVHAGRPLSGPARTMGGSAEPPAAPATFRVEGTELPEPPATPRCQPQLTLLDDQPRAGTPVRLTVELVAEPAHPWTCPGARPRLDIVAVPLTSAEVEPATVPYGPLDTGSVQFRLIAAESGTHRIRFTFVHHDTGIVLQQVETTLYIAGPEASGVETRLVWPGKGRF